MSCVVTIYILFLASLHVDLWDTLNQQWCFDIMTPFRFQVRLPAENETEWTQILVDLTPFKDHDPVVIRCGSQIPCPCSICDFLTFIIVGCVHMKVKQETQKYQLLSMISRCMIILFLSVVPLPHTVAIMFLLIPKSFQRFALVTSNWCA
jgi:hypothetical protein